MNQNPKGIERCDTAARPHPRARTEDQVMLSVASASTAPELSNHEPDAELIALGREFDRAGAEFDAIEIRMNEISERAIAATKKPQALAFRDDDRSLLACYRLPPPADGFYPIDAVSAFRHGRFGLSDAELTRKREIVAAWDDLSKTVAAVADALGHDELLSQSANALARARAAGERIMRLPARSVAGLIVKARAARWCSGEPDEYLEGSFNDGNIIESLIEDLLAMADQHPPAPSAPGACMANQSDAKLRDSIAA